MKTKRKFINVIPLSRQAKYRFVNNMNSFHACIIQEEKDDMMLLNSLNGEYCFWIQKKGNEHWRIQK